MHGELLYHFNGRCTLGAPHAAALWIPQRQSWRSWTMLCGGSAHETARRETQDALRVVPRSQLRCKLRAYLLRPRRSGRTIVPRSARPGQVRGRLYGVGALRRDEAVFVKVVPSRVGVVGSRRAGERRIRSGRAVVARRAGVAG